ncbi:MAG: tetratricopeptide repeat protein [Xanthomonadales bacterium]|jgi:TolB-like protein/Flp pilus assembly protein TadD|nr:tetratricopeptide repeat protein [Xanthomonadales bacterium]
MASLWTELKRRNVIRMTVLYSVAGWVLLQIADILFGLLDVPGWGLRLVLGLLLLGLPLVVIFSWVFEMTPEGIKRESEIDRSESVTTNTGRKIDRLIIFGLVAIVAVLLADRFLLMPDPEKPSQVAVQGPAVEVTGADAAADPAGDTQQKSIAVLPFVNMSGDEENEYFSDGLTEELLNLLAKVDDLRVSSRTSSFAFKGKDTSIPSVARELKVANILEGSVRKSGATVRITAQLIDVDTDSHLWSETYDRQLDDIFAIQDEIAQAVVDALKVQLLEPGELAPTVARETDTDAYLLYLRARHTYELGRDTRDDDMVARAIEQYETVLERDPDYALAYAGLSDAYGFQSIRGDLDTHEGYERSREMAEKALAIDPDLVEALLALADIQLEFDWDMEAAERSYLRALEIRPSDAEGLRTYGYFLATDGRYDEAFKYYQKALEVDPMQLRVYYGLAMSYIFSGNFEEMAALTEKLAAHRDERFMERWNQNMTLITLRFKGEWAELIERLPQEPESIGDLQDAAIAYYHTGDEQRAREYLDRMIEIAEEKQYEFSSVAAALVQMGQPDRALEYLEKALQTREVNFPFIRHDPDLEPLFDDPRFLDLLQRAGIKPPKKGSG